jgi:hypothetical protein
MARGPLGQKISFAIAYDEDQKYTDYVRQTTKIGDSIRSIVGARGRPEMAAEVARLNKVANPNSVLRHKHHKNKKGKWVRYPHDLKTVRLPGTMRKTQLLEVYAHFDGRSPRVEAGYAKIEPVDRPGRSGVSHFTGYDPIRMSLPITFDAWRQVNDRNSPGPGKLEEDIDRLERMAGRGDFKGSARGSPPLLRISTLDDKGVPLWLIPQNYQWSSENDTAPLWRIADIDWDDSPVRNTLGNRMRQHATVTVETYATVSAVPRSVVKRVQNKQTSKGGKNKHGSGRVKGKK